VWIAPGARHHITVIEAAQFRTLYVHAGAAPAGWSDCRVLMVSALLRELIGALDALPTPQPPGTQPREALLTGLVLDELAQSTTQALGVPLPHPRQGDKRLRALCEAVLHNPLGQATLAGWATGVGASERTITRLFRDELGLTYLQWRQQVLLAHALPLLARGTSVSQVASLSGYASESAFSAMFKAAMGQPPSHFRSHA